MPAGSDSSKLRCPGIWPRACVQHPPPPELVRHGSGRGVWFAAGRRKVDTSGNTGINPGVDELDGVGGTEEVVVDVNRPYEIGEAETGGSVVVVIAEDWRPGKAIGPLVNTAGVPCVAVVVIDLADDADTFGGKDDPALMLPEMTAIRRKFCKYFTRHMWIFVLRGKPNSMSKKTPQGQYTLALIVVLCVPTKTDATRKEKVQMYTNCSLPADSALLVDVEKVSDVEPRLCDVVLLERCLGGVWVVDMFPKAPKAEVGPVVEVTGVVFLVREAIVETRLVRIPEVFNVVMLPRDTAPGLGCVGTGNDVLAFG